MHTELGGKLLSSSSHLATRIASGSTAVIGGCGCCVMRGRHSFHTARDQSAAGAASGQHLACGSGCVTTP